MLRREKLGIALIDPERSRRYWLSPLSVVERDSDARRDSTYVYVHEKDISSNAAVANTPSENAQIRFDLKVRKKEKRICLFSQARLKLAETSSSLRPRKLSNAITIVRRA